MPPEDPPAQSVSAPQPWPTLDESVAPPAPFHPLAPGRTDRLETLELLLAEVHLVSGADHLSVASRADRIIAIAATIGSLR